MASVTIILAFLVDLVHLAIIVSTSMISYFYVCYRARRQYKKQLVYTSSLAIVSLIANLVVGRCPLTVVSEQLRQYADPSFTMIQGFIPYYLNTVLGFNIPLVGIFIVTYFMVVIPPIITFVSLGYGKQS